MEMFDSVGEVMEEQDVSHKIVHIHVNLPIIDDDEIENDERGEPTRSADNTQLLDRYGKQAYTKKIIKFASNYVKGKVINKLETDIKNNLRMETKLSLEAGIGNPLLGQVFEQIAYKVLRNGGNFHTRSLKFNSESIVTITNQNEILELSENDIDPNQILKDLKIEKLDLTQQQLDSERGNWEIQRGVVGIFSSNYIYSEFNI